MGIFEKAKAFVENQQKLGNIPMEEELNHGENLFDEIQLNGKTYIRIFDGYNERFVEKHLKNHYHKTKPIVIDDLIKTEGENNENVY